MKNMDLFDAQDSSLSAQVKPQETELQPPIPPASAPNGSDNDDGSIDLAEYTHQVYLRYAISVVKGRALPSVSDGEKPVQRRILYAMHRLGLTQGSKPVKSARVVGDVIGKYHPHGDSASYEAMVRMAQDFVLRYPLVDGQGNFGSRDGDSPAAMRYTEVRLTKYAELLLSEVDAGTVDFRPNYDGSEQEPVDLPARLPLLLLNGASGIAVGMATECLPHNMREVGNAAIALLHNPSISVADILQHIKGPDFPGGGQLISSAKDIREAYATGRGIFRVRARWTIEQQARGQWRMVVHELPPGVSVKKVLEEIGEFTDPQVKTGKKDLSVEQKQMKQLFLDALETVRDESGKDASIRIVLEPRSSRMPQEQFITLLLAHTSLESTVPANMVAIGLDGRPNQKNILELLIEWVRFRTITVTRRSQTRFDQVQKRLHILEGRIAVLLNIDEVIKVIREADDPRADLMSQFGISAIQADDILEIRLRQLARLEVIRIEKEMNELKSENEGLTIVLSNETAMRDMIIGEIEVDVKKYGDDRRTLIEVAERAVAKTVSVPDEPCTVILSENGWIRQRTGHEVDLSTLSFKDGDQLLAIAQTRTAYPVVVLDSGGRAYSLSSTDIPGGRSDGVPVVSLLDMPPKMKAAVMCAAAPDTQYLFSSSGGYGFIATLKDLVSRQKAGKAFMTLGKGDNVLPAANVANGNLVAALGSNGKLLLFPLSEMKELSGGKGVIILGLNDGESLIATTVLPEGSSLQINGTGAGKKPLQMVLKWGELQPFVLRRARKGVLAPVKFKPEKIKAI
ncbi:DNA topoisomerase IV subunit A [Nitrosomonas supralitoralis]|uniref:DNA topoisomerase 4 subunit A n=1 Tax=Nitrosomonas supralitoralis TaxID=2116706 RepID=A0A2P7NU23_9PROT|nr:DNA topoisomerase IV subunit A [Nitrosomonas supralitoralis]PSJ16945.1 DNA topoisomerase IV subunit A [Nitrosomonas supralitoralis]